MSSLRPANTLRLLPRSGSASMMLRLSQTGGSTASEAFKVASTSESSSNTRCKSGCSLSRFCNRRLSSAEFSPSSSRCIRLSASVFIEATCHQNVLKPLSGGVEPGLDCLFGDFEDVGDVSIGQLCRVLQREEGPVFRGQREHGIVEAFGELCAGEILCRIHPARDRMCFERSQPAVPLCKVQCRVHRHPVNPAVEFVLRIVAIELFVGSHKNGLCYVGRIIGVSHDFEGNIEQNLLVFLDECTEGALVTFEASIDEFHIVVRLRHLILCLKYNRFDETLVGRNFDPQIERESTYPVLTGCSRVTQPISKTASKPAIMNTLRIGGRMATRRNVCPSRSSRR